MRTIFSGIALIAALQLVTMRSDTYGTYVDVRCAAVDGQMNNLVGYIKMLAAASKPALVRTRESISVPSVDSALIVPVGTDSLCRRAGILLNRAFHKPDSTSRVVYLVRMGNRYWAEEKAVPASHYIVGLVIDSTLTEVLAHPGR